MDDYIHKSEVLLSEVKLGQTNINTSRLSELNKQNIIIRKLLRLDVRDASLITLYFVVLVIIIQISV